MKQAVLSAILLPGFLIFYEPVKQGYLDSAVQIPDFCSEQRQDYRKLIPGKINFQVSTSNSISGIRRYKYWPTICTPRILLFRSEIQSTNTQIKYKPPIVTTRLNRLSYLVVYIFQSLFTFFNICTQIFTLSRIV